MSYRCDKHLEGNEGCDLCVPEEERRKHFECESCKDGYFLNLRSKQCRKCNKCDGLGEYVEVTCKVDQDAICDVYTCDYTNCKDCVSLRDRVKHGECLTCYEGFYLDDENSKCLHCSDECEGPWQYESQKCDTKTDRECQSYECLKGTRHNPHCATCVEEEERREHYECAQCYHGYYLDAESHQCKSCGSCATEDCSEECDEENVGIMEPEGLWMESKEEQEIDIVPAMDTAVGSANLAFGNTHNSMSFAFISGGVMMSIVICAFLANKAIQNNWKKNQKVTEYTSLLIEA